MRPNDASKFMTTFRRKPFGDESDPRGFWQLLLQHLEHLQVRNYSADTIRTRALYVRTFALWCLDRDIDHPLAVTKPLMESFQRHLFRYRKDDGEPLSWKSQKMNLSHPNLFFRYLVKMNHVPFNPCADIELPKQPKSLPKAILSEQEVERVLAQPDITKLTGLRDRAILETLYSTGIRRTELCNLRLDSIDVERRTLFVRLGKGQKDRYVPIGTRALLWIARYVETARDRLLLDAKEPALFLTQHGRPLQPDSLTEYAHRYIASSGVNKEGSCHIFRHTMATLMLENGAELIYLQSILGHERLETTQIYTRVSLRKLLETHDKSHPAEQPPKDEDTNSNEPPTEPTA